MTIPAMQQALMAAVITKDMSQEDRNTKLASTLVRSTAPWAEMIFEKKFIDKFLENERKINQLEEKIKEQAKSSSETAEDTELKEYKKKCEAYERILDTDKVKEVLTAAQKKAYENLRSE